MAGKCLCEGIEFEAQEIPTMASTDRLSFESMPDISL